MRGRSGNPARPPPERKIPVLVYADERSVSRILASGDFQVMSTAQSPVPDRCFTWTTDPDSLEIWRRFLPFGADIPLRRDDEGVLLHLAAGRDDVPLVELLLTHGASVNARSLDGRTPLHVAADLGRAPTATLLLQKGARVDEKASNCLTPLHLAARRGHEAVCKVLLARGADVRAAVRSNSLLRGTTPLQLAIESDNAGLVSLLLHSGADVNQAGQFGASPLQAAVARGHPRVCNVVLNHSPSVDSRNKSAFRAALRRGAEEMKPVVERMRGGGYALTAADARDAALLHGAVRTGCVELLQELLESGADPNAIESKRSRKTLLHAATERADVDALRLLLRRGADPNAECSLGRTPLFSAALANRLDLAAALIQAGARLTAHDSKGKTVLSAIYLYDMPEMATLLLESGADPNDRAPVVRALRLGLKKVVGVLCQFGARGDVADKTGRTALHETANLGDAEMLEVFLKNSSDLDVLETSTDRTPMIEGIWSKNSSEQVLKITKLFLCHGADPNKESPILYAVMKRLPKVVEALCQFGARVNDQDHLYDILWDAATNGDVDTVRILIQYGANVFTADRCVNTPLLSAALNGHLDVVKVLTEFGALPVWPESPDISALSLATDGKILEYLLEYNFRYIMTIITLPYFARGFANIVRKSKGHRNCLLDFVCKMEIADVKPEQMNDSGWQGVINRINEKYSPIFGDSYDNPIPKFLDRKFQRDGVESCMDELNKMKETYVGGSPWTLHDVFTKSVHCLAAFARNKDFANPPDSPRWLNEDLDWPMGRERGPRYGRILRYQHQKACQRRELIDGALLVSGRLFKHNRGIPIEVVEIIFSYLSAQDLLVFKTACCAVQAR
ncbi:unnamed protein product [Bemisia tabaci]|uniref:Uncharacterized protein n=1 Tax=Bemisia tabaci TaxID=7038 RepID=A0A9P0F999_BEMTA|nr:unnamed protein product [Bemisia tabaci]